MKKKLTFVRQFRKSVNAKLLVEAVRHGFRRQFDEHGQQWVLDTCVGECLFPQEPMVMASTDVLDYLDGIIVSDNGAFFLVEVALQVLRRLDFIGRDV